MKAEVLAMLNAADRVRISPPSGKDRIHRRRPEGGPASASICRGSLIDLKTVAAALLSRQDAADFRGFRDRPKFAQPHCKGTDRGYANMLKRSSGRRPRLIKSRTT